MTQLSTTLQKGSEQGTIYGVGLGPGALDLLSVRSDKLIRNARHVAFFRKAGKAGQARQIVLEILPENCIEFAMEYPVTTEIPLSDPRYNEILSAFYEECCAHLKSLSDAGEDVVVLCEGDPFFYGSFMHLYNRLVDKCPVQVVPAITGMSGAWTATGMPITWGDDILTVLMGTLAEEVLATKLAETDAAIIMKIGRNLDKIKKALSTSGRLDAAYMVEYATMGNQSVQRLVEYDNARAPYFSIIVLHGHGRRP